MILAHRAALNGVELDSLDNRILIQGIDEAAGKEQISAVSLFGGTGQRITNQHRDSLDVTVRFSMRIKKNDMEAREELFERVSAWAAGGGWLTVNYKPERRLRVICANFAPAGDMWNWANIYSIVFRAYSIPYWQQDVPNKLMASGSTFNRQFGVAGSAQTVLDVEFKNNGGTCTTFKVVAGASMIELTGLNLVKGQTLAIKHTDDGLLQITAGGSSVLDKRTVASSDDLYVSPGTVTVYIYAPQAGTVTISCAGRYA